MAKCPYCGNTNIKFSGLEIYLCGYINQREYICNECGEYWWVDLNSF